MKILFAGNFRYYWYEETCAQALESLGHEVVRFSWRPYFNRMPGKIEEYCNIHGPFSAAMNRKLLRLADEHRPDVVFIWRGTMVTARTVERLRERTGAKLVSYNNDDPFGPLYDQTASIHLKRIWRTFRQAISAYDVHFVFRKQNIEEFRLAGAKTVHVLMPYFTHVHRPVQLSELDRRRYECDVVFVGHHEADGRVEALRALVRAGFYVRLFGTGWTKEALGDLYETFAPVVAPYDEEYVKALCGAKIALSFLSKLNRDTYTRRSFEIPACGTVMAGEYTDDLARLFTPDKEAVYFSSPRELVEKVADLLSSETKRQSIAEQGRRRCLLDDHGVVGRMRYFIETLNNGHAREH